MKSIRRVSSIYLLPVVSILLQCKVDAFLPPSLHRSPPSLHITDLNAKRDRAGLTPQGKNESSKKGKKQPKNSRAAQMNQPKKNKRQAVAPPWQVVSRKDMAKNMKAEETRRELAKQGIHNVKDESNIRVSKSFLSNQDKALIAWKRFKLKPSDPIDFIGAYLDKQRPPKLGAPEVAFLGRSNVGKSSLLNKLIGSESARVGKTPGATASVNLYGIFRKQKALLGLVDLPGFGYAKLSKESKESVQQAAEEYLGKRKELALGVLLVDIRRVPSDDDRAVLAALYDKGVPILVVATKIDKVSSTQLEGALTEIRNGLGLPEGQPFSVSCVTGVGVKELWRIILEACEQHVGELNQKMESGEGMETIRLFDNNDEMAYDQGYDWIQDRVMYEDEIDDWVEEEEEEEEESFEEEDFELEDVNSMRYLKKKAKLLEKKGGL